MMSGISTTIYEVRVVSANTKEIYNSWGEISISQRWRLTSHLRKQLSNSDLDHSASRYAHDNPRKWVTEYWGQYKGEWIQIQFRLKGRTRNIVPTIDVEMQNLFRIQ